MTYCLSTVSFAHYNWARGEVDTSFPLNIVSYTDCMKINKIFLEIKNDFEIDGIHVSNAVLLEAQMLSLISKSSEKIEKGREEKAS